MHHFKCNHLFKASTLKLIGRRRTLEQRVDVIATHIDSKMTAKLLNEVENVVTCMNNQKQTRGTGKREYGYRGMSRGSSEKRESSVYETCSIISCLL